MLVLSRKVGESITIDGPATIKVVRIQGNRTQIGVEAPPETRILRNELDDSPEVEQ